MFTSDCVWGYVYARVCVHAEGYKGCNKEKEKLCGRKSSCYVPQHPQCSYLISEEVDNLKRVFHDPYSHEFLAIVATMHHQRVRETFHNGTLGEREKEEGGISGEGGCE